jgi:hypothetical protein
MQGSTADILRERLDIGGILRAWQESSRLNIRGDVDCSFHRHNLASLSHRACGLLVNVRIHVSFYVQYIPQVETSDYDFISVGQLPTCTQCICIPQLNHDYAYIYGWS